MNTIHNSQIRRQSLRDSVQNWLEEAILKGELNDGQRLVETEIAQRLGVSRGLVREVFRDLVKTGIVIHDPYRGTFVKAFTPERVRELYTLRTKLEEYAIQLAISQLKDDTIAELENLVHQMRIAADDGDSNEIIELDLEFHRKLYLASGHGLLIDILNGLSRQTHLFILATKAVFALFPSLHEAAESHSQIINALRTRDIQKACLEIQAHVYGVGTRLHELMLAQQQGSFTIL